MRMKRRNCTTNTEDHMVEWWKCETVKSICLITLNKLWVNLQGFLFNATIVGWREVI